MMKKLFFSLLALVATAAFAGASYVSLASESEAPVAPAAEPAANWKLVNSLDYATSTWQGWNFNSATHSFVNGTLQVTNETATSQNYELQYHGADGFEVEEGETYQLRITMKGKPNGTIFAAVCDWGHNGQNGANLNFTAENQTLVSEFTSEFSANCFVMLQSGLYVGTYNIAKIELYQKVVPTDPDAPQPVYAWVDVTADEHVVKTYKDQFSNQSGAITVVSQAQKEQAWDTQIWFVMDKALEGNADIKLTFDAKASSAQNLGFGAHGAPDGNNWKAGNICNAIDVTTEWQTFEREIKGKAGWQSFALDLTKAAEVTYEFKNIKIQENRKFVDPQAPNSMAVALDGTEMYLYNVEFGGFLTAGNNWGTRASVDKADGYKWKFTAGDNENVYTLQDFNMAKGGKWMNMMAEGDEAVYTDAGNQPGQHTWYVVDNGDGTFKIKNTVRGEKMLAWDGGTVCNFVDEAKGNGTWKAISVADFEAFKAEKNAYKEAILAGLKQNTEVGTDITEAAPSSWVGATGNYGSRPERYNTAMYEGNVMTQTISGLVPGTTYAVTLDATASYTSGRGFEGKTGLGYAVVFANEGMLDVEVVDRGGVGDADFGPYTVVGTVDENGELTYGLKNVFAGGNWFVISCSKIVVTDEAVSFAPVVDRKLNPVAVEPAFVCGDEEIALNDHSDVSVETATALVANVINCPEAIGASYNIFEMTMGQDEETTFWNPTIEIAAGEMSFRNIGYAEFEKAINFEAGKKYQLSVTVYGGPYDDPTEVGVYTFNFNGAYVAPEPTFVEVDLTRDMFHEWDSYEANGNIVGAGGCDYQIGVSTGMPYGNASVIGAQYADLSEYNTLSLTVTAGTPRLLLNRPGMGGDQPGFIEINNANSEYVLSTEDGVWVIDLAKIVEEAGYAHLNVIKGANWANVTITSMKLTKLVEVDPEEPVEPAEMTVTPSLFAGFEDLEAAYAGELGTEYTLNTHSLVSVDVAEGLHVEVANCPEAIGITFMLNEMLQGQDEDVTFWHVGKELAVGEINMKLDSYAAFEAPITFYAGTKYQLTVTVFAEVNGEPAEISTTTYQFNGASAPVNGSVADGINSIELNSVNGKFIKNGKVVIVKNGKTYNVNGVQVK